MGAGVIGLLGGVLRSRLVITIAGLLGLSTLVLWIFLQAIDLSPEDLHASDYEVGLWVCVASLVVLTGGVLLMGSPPIEEASVPDEAADEQHRPSAEG